MNINITEEKKVEIDMKEHLFEAIDPFGENIDEKATTSESSHLFIVNKKVQQLDEKKSKYFQSVVEDLLYIVRGARTDVETAI